MQLGTFELHHHIAQATLTGIVLLLASMAFANHAWYSSSAAIRGPWFSGLELSHVVVLFHSKNSSPLTSVCDIHHWSQYINGLCNNWRAVAAFLLMSIIIRAALVLAHGVHVFKWPVPHVFWVSAGLQTLAGRLYNIRFVLHFNC